MITPTPILSHTCASYAAFIVDKLGKGAQHAALLYKQYCRQGSFDLSDPAFHNAAALAAQILALTDTTLPTFVHKHIEGATIKFLLRTHDNLEIESVIIPMKSGATLCISSQIGCRQGCTFCTTGRMGLIRQLTTAEIVAQLFVARHILQHPIRNIVFMGMGEPFDNYDTVMAAARIFSNTDSFALGAKHLTISTSGMVDGIARLTAEQDCIPNLAVSLSAPTDALRARLMPITRRYPLHVLYDAMRTYCQTTRRQILIAYVLLEGINDSIECAHQLADYLQGLDVKINLIPYNPQPRDRYQASSAEVCDIFATTLRQRNCQTLMRRTHGQTITAACGQLGNTALRRERATLQIYSSHTEGSAL
jgi:23S rRNA (adenine2503-C2)-methyltransferase